MDNTENENTDEAVKKTLLDLVMTAMSPATTDESVVEEITAYAYENLPEEVVEQYGVYFPLILPVLIKYAGKAISKGIEAISTRKSPIERSMDKGSLKAAYIKGIMAGGLSSEEALEIYTSDSARKTCIFEALMASWSSGVAAQIERS